MIIELCLGSQFLLMPLNWILQMGPPNGLSNERKQDWLGVLINNSFGNCEDHEDVKFNEKNVFCVDCEISLCRHCKEAHSLHRRFQIYRYCYQDVVRHSDLLKYFDCSNIQVLYRLLFLLI